MPGKLVAIGEIMAKLGGVSRQRADEITRRKTFPDPVQMAGRFRLWDEGQVDAWIAEHRKPTGEATDGSTGE